MYIEIDGVNGHIEFPITVNKWHSLFLMMDDTMICWYWDMNTNGIMNANLNVLSSNDDMYLGKDESYVNDESTSDEFSSGTFDVMSIVISDKIFRQGEVNRIYENWMEQ